MVAGSNPVPRSKILVMWFVYVLRSKKDGWFYVGFSGDVAKRLVEHNRGYNRSTKSRRPFELLHVEECSSRQAARDREKYFKSGKGRQFLNLLLGENQKRGPAWAGKFKSRPPLQEICSQIAVRRWRAIKVKGHGEGEI
jgi:putative endonuclease